MDFGKSDRLSITLRYAVAVGLICTLFVPFQAFGQAVDCKGEPATIVGTSGNDTITGTEGNDVIKGLGGDDTIYGLGGDDIICGNQGNDTVFGGQGSDLLYGGYGNDMLRGDEGDDSLVGGAGRDNLDGGTGSDTCNGEIIANCGSNDSPPTDTTVPSIIITSPSAGSTVSGTITISAAASDNIGVTKVEFYLDGLLIGTDTSVPYTFSLNTVTKNDGVHTLATKAYDAASNSGISPSVIISISNVILNPDSSGDHVAPTVSITSPSAGLTVSGTITISATAFDSVGVTRIEFYFDGAMIGSQATDTYNSVFNTNALSNGPHSLTAKAYDAAGNIGTSAISVTINNISDTIPPTVSISSPFNGAIVSGTTTVSVTASDNIGVSKVELYVSNTFSSVDSSAAYSFTVNVASLPNGPHTFLAKAYDANGNYAIAMIAVEVRN